MNLNRLKFLIALCAALLLAYLLGFLTCRNQVPPYPLLKTLWSGFKPTVQHSPKRDALRIVDVEVDKQAIIARFSDPASIRHRLVDALVVKRDLIDVSIDDSRNRVLITSKLYGIKTTSVLTKSTSDSKSCLRIYIQGHDGDPFLREFHNELLIYFISNGCDVLSMSMLGIGLNEGEASFPSRHGEIKLDTKQAERHGNYAFFFDKRNPQLDPLALFISPHYHQIRYLSKNYSDVKLMGISGGAWYVSFLAALLPEIKKTINYAGSVPFEYRKYEKNHGDWEQVYSPLYNEVAYWDLYFLGTLDVNYESNRQVILVFNTDDPCCFSNPYASHLKAVLDSMAISNLSVVIDESTKHSMNPPLVKSLLR